MRMLVTIPHYCKQETGSKFGSGRSARFMRGEYLRSVVDSLHIHFDRKHAFVPRMGTYCNDDISCELKIVVCTTGNHHAIESLQHCRFEHVSTNVDPSLLGYECHDLLRQSINDFDMFCFLEDDIYITDSMFFWKLNWFAETQNGRCVLMPNRYETWPRGPVRKLFIDGKLTTAQQDWEIGSSVYASSITEEVFSRYVKFIRPDNPHAGCFFLTQDQMIQWSSKPYFLDRSHSFVGPLESAATLGICRTFGVYKPAAINASFLEVCHLDNRNLGRSVMYKDSFVLKRPT